MQFLLDILVVIVMAYVGATNQLAQYIAAWLGEPSVILTTETTTSMQPLTSQNPAIPDILLRSPAYQQASLLGTNQGNLASETTDPLNAIVNIFCTFTTENYIRTTTGTGFFVSFDGVILTNAHVAQYLLLSSATNNSEAECAIRIGDPAVARYRAELLYIPPAWITSNAALIDATTPMGTGERDYALLYITSTISGEPLPARFPALSINTEALPVRSIGATVHAAGYPARALRTEGPSAQLTPTKATTQISELYTFGSNLADVFSIRGTPVGAEGASGGPVVNDSGATIGLIVTRGNDATDGPGSLRAITVSHIDRTITQETGFSLRQNIGGNVPYRAEIFRLTMTPFLRAILERERQL